MLNERKQQQQQKKQTNTWVLRDRLVFSSNLCTCQMCNLRIGAHLFSFLTCNTVWIWSTSSVLEIIHTQHLPLCMGNKGNLISSNYYYYPWIKKLPDPDDMNALSRVPVLYGSGLLKHSHDDIRFEGPGGCTSWLWLVALPPVKCAG